MCYQFKNCRSVKVLGVICLFGSYEQVIGVKSKNIEGS